MRVAAALGVLASLSLAGPALAQDSVLLDRIEGAGEGWVAVEYAIEDDVRICENGVYHGRSHYGHRDDDRRRRCSEGTALVEFRLDRGEVREVDLVPVGQGRADLSFGRVDMAEVADALLTLAERSPWEDVAEDALPAAVFARGAVTWPRVLGVARDRSRPEEVRSGAVFWLGQEAAEAATRGLAELAEDTAEDRDLREAAVFALSQRPEAEGVPILMELARTADEPDVRRKALFWLAQSESSEVLDFFERILRGG